MKQISDKSAFFSQQKKWFFSSEASLSLFAVSSSLKNIKLFIAKAIARDLPKLKSINLIEASYFNKINFMQDIEMITLLTSILTFDLKEDLICIIKLSSQSNSISLAAVNAIFILNRAGYKFRNLDFGKINIPGADLSESLFFNVNFEESCLKRVNFSQSRLYNCNFRSCDLSDALFSNFQTIWKHDKEIWNFVVSKSGQLILICSNEDTSLWNLNQKTQLFTIDFVSRKALFSPCENLFVLMGRSKTMFVNWNGKSAEITEKSLERLYCAIFSPSGNYIGFSNWSCIEVVDSENFNIFKRLEVSWVTSFVFSKCEKFIIIPRGDWIEQLPIQNEKSEKILRINSAIRKIAFSPNYKYLICDGEYLFVINFESREIIFKFNWISDFLQPLSCCLPHGDNFVFNDLRGLHLLDIEKQKITAQIRENFTLFRHIYYPISSRYIMIRSKCGGLELWDLESQKAQNQIELFKNCVIGIAFSQCEKYLYQVTEQYIIGKCNIKKNSFKTIIKGDERTKIELASFSSCRVYCALGLEGTSIDLWNLETRKKYNTFKGNFGLMTSLVFSFSGKLLFVGCKFSIIIWSLEQNKLIANLKSDTTVLAVTPSENYFASANNNSVLIWKNDLSFDKTRSLHNSRKQSIISLTFSDCSQFLFAGDTKGCIIMWNYLKKEIVKEFQHGNLSVRFLISTPIGLAAVIGNQVVLLNDKTGEKIDEVDMKVACARAFTVSKSGEWVASGGLHRTVKICRFTK